MRLLARSPLCGTSFWHIPSGWLSECLRIKPITDFTAFYIFADICNFSVPVLLPPIYSARILGIQPIHFILSPTYNVLYIHRDSMHTQYTPSFYNIEYKLPINFLYCFEPLCLHILLRNILWHGLAHRLALDFFTSGPYLQRKIHPIKGRQFLLNMFILDQLSFRNLYLNVNVVRIYNIPAYYSVETI